MSDYKNALIVMDLPKQPQTALQHGLHLHGFTGGHLHAVSFCWHPSYKETEIFDAHQRRTIRAELLRTRREWLGEQMRNERCLAADIDTQTVWTDDILGWITHYVNENACDLVIKSVRKRGGPLHTPLDWQLIRTCPVSVMLAVVGRNLGSGNVLAALDLRHDDRRHMALNAKVLDTAQQMADVRGGRMHCVYVLEYSKVLSDLDFIDRGEVRRKGIARAREMLDILLDGRALPKSRIHLPSGSVGGSVAGIARKIKAELVVMGTAARTGIRGRLLGNSAEKVLDEVPCDVMTVRPGR